MSTFDEYASQSRSEKITLCHVEPSQRLSVFTLFSGNVYTKQVPYFISAVKVDGLALTVESTTSLSAGSYYYNGESSTLYVRMSDDSNPKTKTLVVTYRLFFATSPVDIPSNLTSGITVNYDARLISNSSINKSLDEEQIGLVLETSTSVTFENTDGFFDGIYDNLIWENKKVALWLWFPKTPLTEAFKIFDGVIQDKNYSSSVVSFQCKDLNYSLRENLAITNFSLNDGTVPERFINKPKRRLFGQFKQLQCTPIDAILSGYPVTGTITITDGSSTATGAGTSFLDQLSPEDTLIYNDGFKNINFSIESIQSNTSLTLSQEAEISLASVSVTNRPKIPWRKKNRRWHIAGHKLRSPSTTITSVISASRFNVADISDIFSGDIISVDGENTFVNDVNGDQIRLNSNLQAGAPSIGNTVSKIAVSKAYYNGNEIFIDRDWTLSNITEGILVLDNLAEFNVTPEITVNKSMTFTNNSRSVVVSGLDLRTEFKSRDWIRSSSTTHTTWYEILEVLENSLLLRIAYAGPNISGNPKKKNVEYINDNSIITVDCLGQERSGAWIKTASDAVKDILQNDLSFTNLNLASFTQSKDDCPFILSLAIPSRIGGNNRKIRDVFNDINKSVFGSLVIDNDFNFKYMTLNADKPTEINYIQDDDLVRGDISINSKNEIKKKIIGRYQYFADRFTGEESFELYEFENDFTDKLVGVLDELEINLYLFKGDDAKTIVQRYALFYSLSTSIVSFTSNLFLAKKSLNDKVMIKFDRLFQRFGSLFRGKIGLVNKVSLNQFNTTIQINDLGNIFNRVAVISDDSTSDFTSSTDDEKILNAWIVDDDILTPDASDDSTIYTNLIG